MLALKSAFKSHPIFRAVAVVVASTILAVVFASGVVAQTLTEPNSQIKSSSPPATAKSLPTGRAESCSKYGDGFVYVPATDTCIKLGGFGPWIVTTDEIPDSSRLTLRTRLNGTEVQHGTTDDLIFSMPWIVSYISGFTELVPGDVIATGTPQGVGFARKPPLWMKPGDVVEVDISGIGTLRNRIVDER
jgi:hypothetical protein